MRLYAETPRSAARSWRRDVTTRACATSLGLALGFALTPGCAPSDKDIQAEIEAARACADVSECVDIGGECPFGCSIVVNKGSAARIKELLKGHNETCAYDCVATSGIECKAGLCAATF
jgi:hypothetical protein